jgi:hypothetical protein
MDCPSSFLLFWVPRSLPEGRGLGRERGPSCFSKRVGRSGPLEEKQIGRSHINLGGRGFSLGNPALTALIR